MAKKQLPTERNRNPKNNSKSPAKTKTKTKTITKTKSKIKTKSETKKPSKIIVKNSNKRRSKITETANDDTSSEDTELAVSPSLSVESEDHEVAEFSEAEDDEVEQRSLSEEEEEEEEEAEEEVVEEVPKKKPKSVKKKGTKKDNAKGKGKQRSKKGRDKLEAEEKSENALYTFPMNRISRIVRSDNPDVKIAQEAVFLINKASEKFLQVFSKEAYASAFLQKKKQIAYHHLSSVVSKRKRFEFLSDFVPEKVKAEDALPQVAEAEEMLRIEY